VVALHKQLLYPLCIVLMPRSSPAAMGCGITVMRLAGIEQLSIVMHDVCTARKSEQRSLYATRGRNMLLGAEALALRDAQALHLSRIITRTDCSELVCLAYGCARYAACIICGRNRLRRALFSFRTVLELIVMVCVVRDFIKLRCSPKEFMLLSL
jgi:hypothetical protein